MKKHLTTFCLLISAIFCYAQTDLFLDHSFDGDGRRLVNAVFRIESLIQQPDGKILAATRKYGPPYINSNSSFNNIQASVIRLNQDGSIDTGFGINGISTIILPDTISNYTATDIALQNDGKIIVGILDLPQTLYKGGIVRLNSNGTIDNSFGVNQNGIVEYDQPISGIKKLIILQNDKILVSSRSTNSIGIKRFTANGFPDYAFGNNAVANHVAINGLITDIVELNDSSIIASVGRGIQLYKFDKNGNPLVTFGNNGEVIDTSSYSWINSITADNDGNLFLSGNCMGLLIYKLTPNGELSSTFCDTVTNILSPFDYIQQVYFTPNGKIIGAGLFNHNYCLIKLNADLTPDNSFGDNGIIQVPDSASNVTSSILQNDNKILIGGSVLSIGNIMRFDAGVLNSLPLEVNYSFSIYPNPTQNTVNINLGKASANAVSMQLINAFGQVVKTQTFAPSAGQILTADVSTLPAGLYFAQVQAFGGSKAFRVVKD